ncbi:transglycosylase SLT domain-containing protein [Tepidicaulis sp.]|uniref:transglycosylase SLT domain-containing protein n=1 Tax=Tepidicaulis sp. TaxID=1920809 RepID=UPI003B58E511
MSDRNVSAAPRAFCGILALFTGLALGGIAPAKAEAPPAVPVSRPAPPPPVKYLPPSEGQAFITALDAAEKRDWAGMLIAMRAIKDPLTRDLLDWVRFQSSKSGASFAEIIQFQADHPAWPRQERLTERAEEALLEFPVDDSDVIAWFTGREPVTGDGKLRYGRALLTQGNNEDAAYWIQRAWADHQFSRSREKEILDRHGRMLSLQAHEDRLRRLLWEQRYDDAKRMLQLVSENAKKVAEARLSLMRRTRDADTAFSRVPPQLRGDLGLLYDEARFRRRRGENHQAVPLLLTAPTAPHRLDQAGDLWTERKIAARDALEQGKYKEAYELAKAHGHERGLAFAEGEFMAGWLALQYLNEPKTAFTHFETLANGVSTPISQARGAYWMGRAADAMGDSAKAQVHFKEAAQHSTTFYGQLAEAALSAGAKKPAKLVIASADAAPRKGEASLMARPVMKATLMLYDADWTRMGRVFALHLAETLEHPAELAALAEKIGSLGYPEVAVRIAKTAATRNIVLPEQSYPLGVVPNYPAKGRPVEPAFVYGLSRQESEFNPRAVSHAGARGLMQLMPATAKGVARRVSVPYRRDRLLDDPAYNAMLGSAHLGELLDEFSGSYIMTIAAYNAGERRVDEWVDTFGDPRSTGVDAIDWIESIPYSETRNYVQRVLENIQVYRARLAGGVASLDIEKDLKRNQGTPITAPPPPRRAERTPLAPPSADAGSTPSTPGVAVPGKPLMQPIPERPQPQSVKPQAAAPQATKPAPVKPQSQPSLPLPSPEGAAQMAPVIEPSESMVPQAISMEPEITGSTGPAEPEPVNKPAGRIILKPPPGLETPRAPGQ